VAFPRKHLNDGEELVLDLRPHWLAVAVPTLGLVAAIVVGILVWAVGPDGGTADTVLTVAALALIAVTLVWFLVRLAGWATTNFVLTTDRLISRQGVLAKSGIEIPLERINTVFFNQSIFERVVGAGDLAIESAGERGTQSFSNIRKPSLVQREIYVQIEDNENRKFDRIGSVGAPGLSTAEQLEKLHALLQQGALTQEQYEAERTRLLGG
jgi:uncharacterized membrane protein YdbT with pleckstrin-like domain